MSYQKMGLDCRLEKEIPYLLRLGTPHIEQPGTIQPQKYIDALADEAVNQGGTI